MKRLGLSAATFLYAVLKVEVLTSNSRSEDSHKDITALISSSFLGYIHTAFLPC